ncbi:MAG: hypothetical protein HQ477_03145 [Chloroflexi bacterium]|nr:hypothetical protein [Chloroflexota bacterium]
MNDLITAGRKRTGLAFLLAAIVAVVLVACTETENPIATSAVAVATAVPATTAPPTATSTPAMVDVGHVEKIGIGSNADLGDILVDSNGLTLYIFDKDTDGVSNCAGGCLAKWPPLIVDETPESDSGITATIGTIDLADGTKQVSVNGFPAYYWAGDVAQGDTAGNGAGNVWWVFNPDGTPQRPAKVGLGEHSTLGSILVDGAGLSLYLFDKDTVGVSNCSGGCLVNWPPLLTKNGTAALTGVTGTVGTITRDDETVQVTVNGMPVYYWKGDAAAGDANGQAVGGIWWVLDAAGNAVRN